MVAWDVLLCFLPGCLPQLGERTHDDATDKDEDNDRENVQDNQERRQADAGL